METIVPSRSSATPHPHPEWFSGPVFVHTLNDGGEPPRSRCSPCISTPALGPSRTRTPPISSSSSSKARAWWPTGAFGAGTAPGDGGRPRGRVALARGDARDRHVSPFDPTGRSVRVASEVAMGDWDTYMEGADEA